MSAHFATVVQLLSPLLCFSFLWGAGFADTGRAAESTNAFVNWETAPVHPVALSPNGSHLAVCNLPDNRLEIFDVSSLVPRPVAAIFTGLDPVTVRFRNDNEAWVINYISDSISVVDLKSLSVTSTISTANEPSDVIFAGAPLRAFVSCAQPNLVQVFDLDSHQVITNIALAGNRPKAMERSADGGTVYVAFLESGNSSTIISAGVAEGTPAPTPLDFKDGPHHGQNPAPNRGSEFAPALGAELASNAPPRVSLIVKKNSAGKWLDDNQGDWSAYVTGTNAPFSGRVPGWDVVDHDLALLDAKDFSVRYLSGLMNLCLGLAVNPVSGTVAVVGTDALNEIRFEPVLNGTFLRVNLALVNPTLGSKSIMDLNPHLNYLTTQVAENQRQSSIGDPRSILWSADGRTAYVAGMGSDNLVILEVAEGHAERAATLTMKNGPVGLALDERLNRLFVLNRFHASVSVVDLRTETVVTNVPFFDPTPAAIKRGRPHLYDTHKSSGLGHISCASCHVDARFDRLAWDLGDPTAAITRITSTNVNFARLAPAVTNHFHPMKGPMLTQTLQDIIGHEPFHWRGDRAGLEQFNGTFTNLQSAVSTLTTNELQELEDFLGTIHFPPNPFREFDNRLATNVVLAGQFSLGRGKLSAGQPLPKGNAVAGLQKFVTKGEAGCIECHTLPAGLGTDMRFSVAAGWDGISQWRAVPLGPNGEHHAALVALPRSFELPFKIPQLRNLYERIGMDCFHASSLTGFGFLHDGGVDSLPRFVQDAFRIEDDQEIANLVAFLLSFSGSDLPKGPLTDPQQPPGLDSRDSPAGVGKQITVATVELPVLVGRMITLASSATGRVDLIVKGNSKGTARGWLFDVRRRVFQSDRLGETASADELRLAAQSGSELTYTLVPKGSGTRLGIDRDLDGVLDQDELDQGSDPADPASTGRRALTLAARLAPEGKLEISWAAPEQERYVLEVCTNLTTAQWQSVETQVITNDLRAVTTVLMGDFNANAYFRVRILPSATAARAGHAVQAGRAIPND